MNYTNKLTLCFPEVVTGESHVPRDPEHVAANATKALMGHIVQNMNRLRMPGLVNGPDTVKLTVTQKKKNASLGVGTASSKYCESTSTVERIIALDKLEDYLKVSFDYLGSLTFTFEY